MARILVVDDEYLFRAPSSMVLRQAGYAVDCAATGEEALKLLESVQPDLVLLDLMMPGMGGLAFLRRLRADERFAALPVVVLSAGSDGRPGTEALKLGARACLLKGSFSLAELTHFVQLASASAPGPVDQGAR
jgi:two-component system phosphate regulon response regulator PhoB